LESPSSPIELPIDQPMNILSLPVVFLRDMMERVKIKDRLSLRLTCRAFDKLVAETNYGFAYDGVVQSYFDKQHNSTVFAMRIDNVEFKCTTEDALKQLLHIRNRLFREISFRNFNICDEFLPLDFISAFRIQEFGLVARSESELQHCLQIMANFPTSKRTIKIYLIP
ncbi:hypothetical protein PENTCL1PPCAC_852, partial [Pristionchus entomophagus]